MLGMGEDVSNQICGGGTDLVSPSQDAVGRPTGSNLVGKLAGMFFLGSAPACRLRQPGMRGNLFCLSKKCNPGRCNANINPLSNNLVRLRIIVSVNIDMEISRNLLAKPDCLVRG